MKSSLDTVDGLTRKLTIQVPAETVDATFDKIYKHLQKNTALKGFRKGKAPLSALKSQYGDNVTQDAIQEIVSSTYSEALQEHTLEPISYPNIKYDKFEEGAAFEYTAEFEIRPEVKLGKYEGLKIEKEKLEISDDHINNVLENIRQSRKESAPVFEDRPAQEGDIAVIDFDGFIDGEPLPGGAGKDHKLELGSNSFIPGFEEGIVGLKVGASKELNLSFPEEYHAKEIAGKPVLFKVELKGLEKSVLPEVNDELAEKVGGFKTLDELKDAIKQDITLGEEGRIKEDTRNRILRALVKENNVEVPKSLLAEQKKMLVDDVKSKMRQQGMNDSDFKEYTEKWDGDFTESASFMIQSSFLVDAIAKEANLKANEQDVEEKIKNYADETGMDVEQIKEFYADPDKRANLKYQLTEEKVVNFLIEKANVTEVEKDKLKEDK